MPNLLPVLAGLVALAHAGAPRAACFGPKDRPTLPVFRLAPPPRFDGDPGYRHYPVSAIMTMSPAPLFSSRATLPRYFMAWANHGPRKVEKSNLTPGFTNRTQNAVVTFTSVDTADACTLAQVAKATGAAQPVQSLVRLVSALPPNSRTADLCLLPERTLDPAIGLALDYEVQDFRTPEQATALLSGVARMARATHRRVILMTNPLDSPNHLKSGLTDAVIQRSIDLYDHVSIVLWGRNRQGDIAASYRSQAAQFGGQGRKAIVGFDLGTTSLADARTERRLIDANPPAGIYFIRNGSEIDGDCGSDSARKIACVAFGRCGV